jgi:hypothetical protein
LIDTRAELERNAKGLLSRDGPDVHMWRATLVFGLVTILAGMGYPLVVGPLFEHSGGWWINPDSWVPLRAASYVANGALGYIYESTNIFVTTPLLPFLLVPVVFMEQHFGLVEGYPMPIPHPSVWLVYGPYALALCAVVFYAARSLADQLEIDRRGVGLFMGVLVLVVVPAAVVWAHFEDVLTLAFVMFALRAMLRGRSLRAALLFGVAIAFKQWALLGVPLLIAATPAEERGRALVRSLALPALLVAFPLAVDWAHASAALIWTRSYPQLGHRALWVSPSVRIMVGNPSRLGTFVIAGAVAWWLRGRTEARLLLAGFGLVFLARLLFEPVLFSYYLCPALGLLLLHERVTEGRYRRTLLVGICLLLWFAVHPPILLWWAVAVALGALVSASAASDLFKRTVNITAPRVR